MTTMHARDWDQRYAASDLVWSAGPNATVAELTENLVPGRALDLGAGEGRNAIWLAARGWQVTAVDFSPVAVNRTSALAAQRLGADSARLTLVTADVLTWEPGASGYDLVLVVFLHLPQRQRAVVHARAAAAVAPAGTLLILGHDRSNLLDGVGGPADPAVLLTVDEVVADLTGTGLHVERAEVITRGVDVAGQRAQARDCLVVARREPVADLRPTGFHARRCHVEGDPLSHRAVWGDAPPVRLGPPPGHLPRTSSWPVPPVSVSGGQREPSSTRKSSVARC